MTNEKRYHNHKSLRLPKYDYTQEGAYFVTVVTYQRQCLFGSIDQGEMIDSPIGEIVKAVWKIIPDHFPNTSVNYFALMPNHIHGIINIVGTRHAVSQPVIEQFRKPITGSIPTIIRSFKSEVTRRINKIQNTPGLKLWQSNYYEHVIRNEEEFEAIYEYMITNPQNWEEDRLFKIKLEIS